MLLNYLKIGLRSLVRHRLFSAINITGLALGLAAFLLINAFVGFERSYDSQYERSSNIYRMSTLDIVSGNIDTKDAMMTYLAAQTAQEQLPFIEQTTVTLKMDELVFRNGSQLRYERNVVSADSNFLDIFSYDVIHGDPEHMFDRPYNLVLTKSKALDYFGKTDVIGRTIEVLGEYNRPFMVSGVLQDIPANTHYKFDMLITDKSLVERFDYKVWDSFNYYAYIILSDDADMGLLQQTFDAICTEKFGKDNTIHWTVDPITDIHLTSDYTYEPETPGSATAVNFMMIISLIILAIAWVNYINLATARALDRAREVGLRKVIGAMRRQLIFQFLMEAFIVNFLAGVLAVLIAELALPWFHNMVGLTITAHVWTHPGFMGKLALFFAAGTLLSGFYPAMVMSSYQPVKVLKGRYHSSRSGGMMRKGLVVVQFAASIVLIAGTFTVHKQLRYMLSRDMGMDTDYVVSFSMPAQLDGEERELQRNS